MPQMAPTSWVLLFMIFSITFMMFNIMNYYSFVTLPSSSMKKMTQYNKMMNWKW